MKRGLIGFVLGIVVVVAAISAVWSYIGGADRERELVLAEISGVVSVTSPTREGVEARPGTRLSPADRVATGASSRAVLQLGRDTRIKVAENSTLEVRAIDDDGVRLELERGALRATVRPGSGAVRVGNDGRDVVSTGGEFEFGVDEDGTIAANVIDGDLAMVGVDSSRVMAGSRATISGSHAEIGPIPDDLLLAVEWPPSRTRHRATMVKGRTNAGALVHVTGEFGSASTRADSAGNWGINLKLRTGDNNLTVRAVDPLGEERRESVTVVVKDRTRSGKGKISY